MKIVIVMGDEKSLWIASDILNYKQPNDWVLNNQESPTIYIQVDALLNKVNINNPGMIQKKNIGALENYSEVIPSGQYTIDELVAAIKIAAEQLGIIVAGVEYGI